MKTRGTLKGVPSLFCGNRRISLLLKLSSGEPIHGHIGRAQKSGEGV